MKLIVCHPLPLSNEAIAQLAAQVAEFVGVEVSDVLILPDGTTVCAFPGGAATDKPSKKSASKPGEDKP